MLLTRVISTSFDKVLRRVVKLIRYSKTDTINSFEVLPFGVDSNPLANMIAVHCDTGAKRDSVVLGYLNVNQVADHGETRLFALDVDGNLKGYLWLKNDGTLELLGNTKHFVRFEELETAFNQLKSDFNSHSHTANGVPPTVTSSADISGAKISEIKTL